MRERVPAGQISGYRKILRDVAEASCNGHGEESLVSFNKIFAAQEFPYRIGGRVDSPVGQCRHKCDWVKSGCVSLTVETSSAMSGFRR